MKSLSLALYTEGATDQRFLSNIIRRTSRRLLDQYGRKEINVEPVASLTFSKVSLKQDECILQAARQAIDFHVLIVHADADHRTNERALHERFQPGYTLVQNEDNVCKHLVPLILVQMTEAWMLVDHEALQRVLGSSMSPRELSLPAKAKQIEADANPKQTLSLAVQKAYAHRSKRQRLNQIDLSTLYAFLGRSINLERLNSLPAYQQFVNDLTGTLQKLDFISQ